MSRLSEILNVEEGQEFEYESRLFGCVTCKIVEGIRYSFDGYCWVGCTDECILTDMINHPEKIKIIPTKPKLTEQQITAIKGRIAEGWKYIVRDGNDSILFFEQKPEYDKRSGFFDSTGDYSIATLPIYDFLKPGECFYLPDLIGGAENE